MKFLYSFFLSLVYCISFLSYTIVVSVNETDNNISDLPYVLWEILVIYKDESEHLIWANSVKSLSSSRIKSFELSQLEIIKIETGADLQSSIFSLLQDPNIAHVQPNFIYESREILSPNDTYYSSMWAIENTWQNVNWTSWTSDADIDWIEALDIYHWNVSSLSWVIVAVIDDWVAFDHPDLIDAMWESSNCSDSDWNSIWECINWFDFWDNDKFPSPVTSHWTHVAWIIASQINNSKWTLWISPHAKIMALKNRLTTSEIVKAIDFAKNNWSKVINASWWAWITSNDCSSALDFATYLTIGSFPWVFVVAAWNDNKNHDLSTYFDFPADYAFDTSCWWWLDNILVVWATDQNDNKASFSDYWNVHIWAPWTNIYSTQFSSSLIFTEDFDSYSWSLLTGFTVSDAWNWWVSNWELLWDLDNPMEADMQSSISSLWIDLSSYSAASFNFTSWCDTEITYTWWEDYMSISFQAWSELSVKELWDEAWTSNNLNISKVIEWDYTKYVFEIEIAQNYLVENFQYVFWWNTDSDNNNFNWCKVDDISIYSFDNWISETYWYKNWTSMSTPYVSWLAAMIYAMKPNYSVSDVVNLIIDSWDSVANLSSYFITWKRINAYNAIWKLADPSVDLISVYTDSWKTIAVQDSTWVNSLWPYLQWQEPINQWVISWYVIAYENALTSLSWSYSYAATWFDLNQNWVNYDQWVNSFSIYWFNDMWATWSSLSLFDLYLDNWAPWTWTIINLDNYYSNTWIINVDFIEAQDSISGIDYYNFYTYSGTKIIFSWSLTWTWFIDTWIWDDWDYFLNIRAVDLAWNIWNNSNTWSFIIDSLSPEKPSLSINSWSVIWVGSQTWVPISWVLSLTESWSLFIYSVSDASNNIVSWSIILWSETWFNIEWLDLISLDDGNLYLDAYIVDQAWNIWITWTSQVIKETTIPSWLIIINSWSDITNLTWITAQLSSSEYPVDYIISWTWLIATYTWTLTKSSYIDLELFQWDADIRLELSLLDSALNISESVFVNIVLDQTSVTWSIYSTVSNNLWSKEYIFSVLTSDGDFSSDDIVWSNNIDSSTWAWHTYSITSWTTWNLIVDAAIIDNAWNVTIINSQSYLIDNNNPVISFTQSWNSVYFTWSFIDNHSWINTWSIKWYYSIWSGSSWVSMDNWTETGAYISDDIWYWWEVYLKIFIEDIVWNSMQYISNAFEIEWDSSFGSTVSLALSNLSSSIKRLALDSNQDTTWLIQSSTDTIDSVIDVSLLFSTWVIIPITVSGASASYPKIIEVYNSDTWLYELESVQTSDIESFVSLSWDTKIIIRTVSASWSSSLNWDIETAVIPSSSWSLTTNWNSFTMIWSWSSVLFSSWITISSDFSWIILPPTSFEVSSWSSLDTSDKPWTTISVWANWQSISFSGWDVTLTIDLWEECSDSAKVKYWDSLSWSWIDYTDTVSNISCDEQSLSFWVSHFSIYWWDWWACSLSQVTCSASCWDWTYQINSWEDCSWWYYWSSCNLATCTTSSSSNSSWWGWGSSVISNQVSTYILPVLAKKEINTFDNIDLKNIKSWILPVTITIKHSSSKYFAKIEKWTKITKWDWSVYFWKIDSPLRVSNTKIQAMSKWAIALRAMQIWNDEENIYFSKPVKLTMSTKWLSESYDRNDISLFSYDYKTKAYTLENDKPYYDSVSESLSVYVDHFSLFVLAYFKKIDINKSSPNWEDALPFQDLQWHWAKSYISNLYERWVFSDNENFYPEKSLNRVELVKIVVEAFWYQKNENLEILPFEDINKNSWYWSYLAWAFENWIISWDSWVNTFRPWDSVNRAEAVKLVLKAANLDLNIWNNSFTDVPLNTWYSSYVNYAAEKWIVAWYWNWIFWPSRDVTRWQIAKIVSRVLVLKETN